MMRALGIFELLAYLALWSSSFERAGIFTLLIIMIGAVHMHMIKLGDSIDKLYFPQIALIGGLLALLLMPAYGKDTKKKSN